MLHRLSRTLRVPSYRFTPFRRRFTTSINFLLDKSGSMSSIDLGKEKSRIEQCTDSIIDLIKSEKVSEYDELSLTMFDIDHTTVFDKKTKRYDMRQIIEYINNQNKPGGETAFYNA